MKASGPEIVVIGAGLVGLCTAVALARRGASVTVLEASYPGMGTSHTSFAWINSNSKEPSSYFDLNLAGVEAHHRLADTLDGDWLGRSGHVEFATDPNHRQALRTRLDRLESANYPTERISVARVRELVPSVVIPDDCDTAAYFPREAYCFTALLTARLLREAASLNVRIEHGAKVTEMRGTSAGAEVVTREGARFCADRVVCTAGTGTGQLVKNAGVDLHMMEFEHPGDPTVGYLAVTNPLPVSVGCIVTSSQLNVRPEGGGRLLLQALDLDVTADPSDVPSGDSRLGKELLARLSALFNGTEPAKIEEIRVGQRVLTADGLTVVGVPETLPWLYVAATHSGVTLAPMLGDGIAAEIFGDSEPLFAQFRPDRLLGGAPVKTPQAPRQAGEQ